MLKSLEISGFKSFAKKTELSFNAQIVSIVGPNGSGKSNVVEAFRFVLGEQSMKTMRGTKGEDLVWSGSTLVPKANRAHVALTFDNGKNIFPLDTESVRVERIVFRDGKNEYKINGSQARLKDVHDLLNNVHIGSSRHHIISQGQADRVLNANPLERREMLEDALGLSGLETKKAESEKKLEQTRVHEREVSLQRKENAPRLSFLKKQIEKKEKGDSIKHEIAELSHTYIAIEAARIKDEEQELVRASKEPRARLSSLEASLSKLRASRTSAVTERTQPADDEKRDKFKATIADMDRRLREHYSAEAMYMYQLEATAEPKEPQFTVSHKEAIAFKDDIHTAEKKARLDGAYARHLHECVEITDEFVTSHTGKHTRDSYDPVVLQSKIDEQRRSIALLTEEKTAVQQSLESIAKKSNPDLELISYERDVLQITSQIQELKINLKEYDLHALALTDSKKALEFFAEEFSAFQIPSPRALHGTSPDQLSDIKQRAIRLKIRYEEIGSIDPETIKEYEQASQRDAFLERELQDLATARISLEQIIVQLTEELHQRFTDGIAQINKEFTDFFTVLFGGGDAKLTVSKQHAKGNTLEERPTHGIDIAVQLPRKRVSTLSVLSGGERALTSIALIFAMSQVHPPPFIILDETDAALDEANSARYAEMITRLSRQSQLIVITHNRATMSVAGMLYGVTMGSDGVSKLLSVKFEEAVRVAK